MKIKIKSYNAVASWRWNTQINKPGATDQQGQQMEEEEDEEDDVCGICQVAFEGCCPNCKVPGDDCPLIFGECTHIFHLHCLLTWLNAETSKNQCPMDRQPWVTAGEGEARS